MSKLTNITLPGSLVKIEDNAFGYSSALTELFIPEGVTTINNSILNGCSSLNMLYIPSTVNDMGQHMTCDCNTISDIYCHIQKPFDINSNNFTTATYHNATLHVKSDLVDTYKNLEGWKNFANIKGDIKNETANYVMMAEASSIKLGETVEIPVALMNNDEINDIQFVLILPADVSIANNLLGEFVVTTTERTKEFSVSCDKIADNTYYVFISSNNNLTIGSGRGAILNIQLQCADNAQQGNCDIVFTNVFVSHVKDGHLYYINVPDFTAPLKIGDVSTIVGDANGDFEINIADVMFIVDHILNRYNSKFIFANADVDGDGRVDVADAMNVVNIILYKPTTNMPADARQANSDLLRMDGTAAGFRLHTEALSPSLTAMEMTVELPDGCRLAGAKPTGKASRTHQAMAHPLGGNRYKVVVFSMDRATVDAGEAFLDLSLEGRGGWVAVKDIQCTDTSLETLVSSDLHAVVTGIGGVFAGEDAGNSPVYNVSGQRMAKPRKGVNISKGRKVVVK